MTETEYLLQKRLEILAYETFHQYIRPIKPCQYCKVLEKCLEHYHGIPEKTLCREAYEKLTVKPIPTEEQLKLAEETVLRGKEKLCPKCKSFMKLNLLKAGIITDTVKEIKGYTTDKIEWICSNSDCGYSETP